MLNKLLNKLRGNKMNEITNVADDHINKLGFKAKDIVTGFSGIITLVSFDLYGCVQFVITPKIDKSGDNIAGRWFDVTRLEMKNKKPIIVVPNITNKAINNLGFKAKDIVTGFSGVVSSIGINMYGHIMFTLTPKTDNNAKHIESEWFNISRLELINNNPVMKVPDFDKGYIAEGKKGPSEKRIPSEH